MFFWKQCMGVFFLRATVMAKEYVLLSYNELVKKLPKKDFPCNMELIVAYKYYG